MNNNNVASSTPPVCSKIVLCGSIYVIKTTQLEDEKKKIPHCRNDSKVQSESRRKRHN